MFMHAYINTYIHPYIHTGAYCNHWATFYLGNILECSKDMNTLNSI